MMHRRRRFQISTVESIGILANKLYEHTWTCCSAFAYGDLLLCNDATGPDGAQEYAVLRKTSAGGWLQIESLTVSWYESEAKLLEMLRKLADGSVPNAMEVPVEVLTHETGEYCSHCA